MHQVSWRRVIAAAVIAGVALVVPRVSHAQTGKISGVVTDAQSGQPIEGVQVRVTGTGYGALTQANGRYFIISVPPGTYTVEARRIGYQSSSTSGVQVRIDVTREVNFSMASAATTLTAIRTVAPPTPLVEQGVTGSSAAITSEVIEALPVTSVAGVLALQQGFFQVPQNTDITSFSDQRRNVLSPIRIRGGRGGETLTLIDGIPISNVVFGGAAFDITPSAVSQIDYQKGGFEPQYGNALSGIINIATREGGNNFAGNVEYQSSALGGALGSTPDKLRGFDLLRGYLSGPIPATGNHVKFLLAGQTTSGADRVVQFDNDVNTVRRQSLSGIGIDALDVIPGWRAMGYDSERDIIGKLTFALGSSKINLTAIDYERQREPVDFSFELAGYNPLQYAPTIEDTLNLAPLGYSTYQQIALGSIRADRQLYVASLEQRFGRSNLKLRFGRLDQNRTTCNFYDGVCLGQNFGDLNFTSTGFQTPNTPRSLNPASGTDIFYGGEDVSSNIFRADLESQVTDHHNLQTGVFYQRHDINFNEVRNVGTNNVVVSTLKYNSTPYDAAAYLQDKIEYDFLTVKLGFRYDYGRATGLFFSDPQDPTNGTTAREVCNGTAKGIGATTQFTYTDPTTNVNYEGFEACAKAGKSLTDSAARIAQKDDFAEADPRKAFSPRIGVSFPLTERSALFFNAGRYSQNPTYNNLYQNTNVGITSGSGSCASTQVKPGTNECLPTIFSDAYTVPFLGNTRLRLEQTTSYEVGYASEIGTNYALNVTLFSKDQTGLSGLRQSSRTLNDPGSTYGSSTPRYTVIVNQDYGTSRGLEVQFRRRLASYWGYDVNYSFSKATTNAAPPDLQFQRNANEGQTTLRQEITSEIDQPHAFNASVYFKVDERAPAIRYGSALRNTYLTFTARAASGIPYTPTINFNNTGAADDNRLQENSGRSPSTFQIDLLAGKDFQLANIRYGLFARVANLTDRKNCLQVFTTTGRCDAGQVDQARRETGNSTRPDDVTSTYYDRAGYFGERRSVYAGIRANF
ncbi:MAG TPA: TonB-dependent receptor [Gemmatimonadaceae bacterium]|nr:TonB-dependent receptor [Gemmatimonadaceae bacterium]